MKERPIIFSAPMVRALLDGRKTQTRRVINPQPIGGPTLRASYVAISSDRAKRGRWTWDEIDPLGTLNTERGVESTRLAVHCPYGAPGDRLWVRETWQRIHRGCDHVPCDVVYRSDFDNGVWGRPPRPWTPSIHMPRWASRLELEITELRVQRVQEITPNDCVAEGIEGRGTAKDVAPRDGWRIAFAQLWDSINARRGHGWDANPWVWAIGFHVRRPVDAPRSD